jgi:hypothetical protein
MGVTGEGVGRCSLSRPSEGQRESPSQQEYAPVESRGQSEYQIGGPSNPLSPRQVSPLSTGRIPVVAPVDGPVGRSTGVGTRSRPRVAIASLVVVDGRLLRPATPQRRPISSCPALAPRQDSPREELAATEALTDPP